MSYATKVYREIGGDALVIVAGGRITIGDVALAVNDDGVLVLSGLPTTDPGVAGALYSDGGVLTVSAGA
jgi:hypothetical protein